MKTLPIARNKNIVVQNAGKETLIYNLVSNKVYCLNETLSKVYAACDGKTSLDEFKNHQQFPNDLIFLALDELKRENLIDTDSEYQSPFAAMTRRQAVRKVGLATFITLPMISSVVAPSAINAASPTGPLMPPGSCVAFNENCPFDGTFRQGPCCVGLRCLDINACISCRSIGTQFFSYTISGTPGGCSSTVCETFPQKNWCCNSATSIAEDIGLNRCICRCP